MNSVQIFSSPQFGEIRTAGTSEKPLFCLADVCKALSIENNRNVSNRLEEEDVHTVDTLTAKGVQSITYVTEQGLYDAIFISRKPEAKAFRRWVTGEVLPSIRKTGGYMTVRPDETPEEIMARALMLANDTLARQQERIAQLNAVASRQTLQIEAQEATIREQAPKVAYHDTVLNSESTYTATQIAKEFGWGAQTLNRKLYHLKVQYKLKGQWLLYANHANKGYTRTSTITFLGSDGEPRSRQITEWTEKGRKFIHSLLKEHRLV